MRCSLKKELLSFVLDRLDVEDDIQTISARLNPRALPFDLYMCRSLNSDDGIFVTFNAPNATPGVFFALSSSRVEDAARYVANLEEYAQESSRHLHHGDVVLTPGGEDAGFPHGSILLRTASSPLLEGIPDQAIIGGKEVFFYLVMPITKRDYTYRANFGHDRLMDMFDAEGRSLLIFDHSPDH